MELQPLDPMALRYPPNCGPYVQQLLPDKQYFAFSAKLKVETPKQSYLVAKVDTVEVVKDDSKSSPLAEAFPGRVVLRISAKDLEEAPCLKEARSKI